MSGPNRFLEQHAIIEAPRVDDDTFRPFWRVVRPRTRLDRLYADGAITEIEWRAGRHFRQAVDTLTGTGVDRGYAREGRGDKNGSATMWAVVCRNEADQFVRRVRSALGTLATGLVWSCVVDDAAWAAVGARLRVDAKTARRWTITAMQALALVEA